MLSLVSKCQPPNILMPFSRLWRDSVTRFAARLRPSVSCEELAALSVTVVERVKHGDRSNPHRLQRLDQCSRHPAYRIGPGNLITNHKDSLRNTTSSQNVCLRCFWTIIFMASSGMFIYQMILLINKYRAYDVTVQTEVWRKFQIFENFLKNLNVLAEIRRALVPLRDGVQPEPLQGFYHAPRT